MNFLRTSWQNKKRVLILIAIVGTASLICAHKYLESVRHRNVTFDYLHRIGLAVRAESLMENRVPFRMISESEYVLAPKDEWKLDTKLIFTNQIGLDGRLETITPYGSVRVRIVPDHGGVRDSTNISCSIEISESKVQKRVVLPSSAFENLIGIP